MGIRPMIYINGSYASYLQSSIVNAFPVLWSARWPNQTNVPAIPVQTGNPSDSYAPIYGPWDDAPLPSQPWTIWQYASTGHVNAIGGGASSCDLDVARGGIEFLKDLLNPALWVANGSGQWTTLSNWNSGQAPVAPVQGTNPPARVGTLTLPTPRLPSTNDTVILDYPGAAITVTLASGSQNIRKLYVRESLNISGGSLTVNYIPSWDCTTNAAQFSAPVTLGGGASLSVHTLQVDATNTFTLSGSTLTFNTINLMPNTTAPAKIALGGDVSFCALTNGTATVTNGTGSGSSGLIDLGGATRACNVASGTDLFIEVPVTNGGLVKTGVGTLHLDAANTYSGGTTLSAGKLLVNNRAGSGTGTGGVTVNGGTLGGTGVIAGAVTVNSGGTLAPGATSSLATLTLGGAPTFNGTNLLRINRNGGSPLADKIALSCGTLSYAAALVVSNAGAAFTGGEVFTLFAAPAYTGAFATTSLPALNAGMNWYLGCLTANGTLKVNRSPVVNPLAFTNTSLAPLQIPIASLTAAATDADGDTITLAGVNLTTTNGATLLTNSTFISYSNNVYVADQFTYTVSDGHGGSATNTVNIAPMTGGQFSSCPTVNANSLTLHFAGSAGSTIYLERSTNLTGWLTIATNVMPANGLFDYIDDPLGSSAGPSSAFYRLRWSP
jgi:autotransporter-associated beta strand protein